MRSGSTHKIFGVCAVLPCGRGIFGICAIPHSDGARLQCTLCGDISKDSDSKDLLWAK